jgi:hypothetical protein
MKNSTDIIVVLDRSGSMSPLQADVIGGFNRFLEDQKKVPGEATMTLVQFDQEYEFVHKAAPLAEVPPFTEETYLPRGSTALLDAVGRAIAETRERHAKLAEGERPEKVVFLIITDGHENSSVEFTKVQVREMVERQTANAHWEFVYLGAHVDAFDEAAAIGIVFARTAPYAGTGKGTRKSYEVASDKIAGFRAGRRKDMAFTGEDRKALAEDDEDEPEGGKS